ncbi:hypothetical protein P4S63_16040 [Pseudoalteromonas sp. B193]
MLSITQKEQLSLAFRQLQKKLPNLLGDNFVMNVETINVKGVMYNRLKLGAYIDKKNAMADCQKLKSQNINCLVSYYVDQPFYRTIAKSAYKLLYPQYVLKRMAIMPFTAFIVLNLAACSLVPPPEPSVPTNAPKAVMAPFTVNDYVVNLTSQLNHLNGALNANARVGVSSFFYADALDTKLK